MMRHYPLKIENIGDDTYRLMSRGHHDVHEFMAAVRAEGYQWPLGLPRQLWFKAIPRRGYTCYFIEVSQSVRGAFPVTYVDEAYGDDTYERRVEAAIKEIGCQTITPPTRTLMSIGETMCDCTPGTYTDSCPTCRQRRDDAITMNEIRRLRSERDRYREALERIADADENNGFARIKIARQALGLSEFP